MDSLRGIFPPERPPQKRDFLKENVLKIKNLQRQSKTSKNKSEYSNKFSTTKQAVPARPRKYSVCENSVPLHRSSNSHIICSSKAPITNLRKSLSVMSLGSREFGTQTVDPEGDEYFLKDTIIRYPSASTIRSVGAPTTTSSTCSRGHLMEPEQERSSRYKSHFSDRRDDYCDKMEHHVTNLSEFLNRGTISKAQHGTKKSILKSSSSLQKLNKNSINESQQRDDRSNRVASATQRSARIETVDISDEENEDQDEELVENKKELEASQRKERGGGDSTFESKKQQQLKAAADDPECPEGHVPLSEDERLDALKIAKNRFKIIVDELNRLPMTSETLRVRNRKIEIEKELRSLEINIRVFSRPKVYVKLTE